MSLKQFKNSKAGSLIAPILMAPDSLARMEAKSLEGRPAVEAIGASIQIKVGTLDDDEKKLVGRWVKQVLEPRGWAPYKKGRVAAGNMFARGTIYRRLTANVLQQRPSAAERIAQARAILAETPYPMMSSQELIAERRKEFEREV
jgi:hypothetical protein